MWDVLVVRHRFDYNYVIEWINIKLYGDRVFEF